MPARTLSEKINNLFNKEKWDDARALIEGELTKPGNINDHWLLTRLATTYYEKKEYPTALEHLKKAKELAPRCPLVLWEYAGTLDALGKFDEAIDVYVSLLRRGAPAIANEECGEGTEWAVGLLTDCLFRIGVCLKHQGKMAKSWRFFTGYEEVVRAGAKSIYTVPALWKQLTDDMPREEMPKSPILPPEKQKSAERALASVSKALSRLAA